MRREEAHTLADILDATGVLRVDALVNLVGVARDRQSDCVDLYLSVRPQSDWWSARGVRSGCGHRFEMVYPESIHFYVDYCPKCEHQKRA
jgi:hypothetical protein